MGGGGKNAASREAERAREEEEARQARIREGTASINDTFSQFDDGFFSGMRDSFMNFARPQIDEQANKAREQLIFSLARSGTLDSSMRANQQGDLQRNIDRELMSAADQARSYENQARTGVESARGDLLSLLQATGDAQGAANSALSRAQILSQPPAYSPIGQLFTDFTSGLAQQAAFERAEAFGALPQGMGTRFQTGLFGPRAGAVRVGR